MSQKLPKLVFFHQKLPIFSVRERRFDKKYRKLLSKPSLTYPGYLLSKSKVNDNVIRRTLRNVSTTFYQFSIQKSKKVKSETQTWPQNHICRCGNDGDFFEYSQNLKD